MEFMKLQERIIGFHIKSFIEWRFRKIPSKEYSEYHNAQIRKVNKQEVNDYINEQKQYLIKLK